MQTAVLIKMEETGPGGGDKPFVPKKYEQDEPDTKETERGDDDQSLVPDKNDQSGNDTDGTGTRRGDK